MSNVEFTDLDALTAPAAADLVAVYDSSTGILKKMTVLNLNAEIEETVTTTPATLKTYGATKLDSSGGALTVTLPDGNYVGQIKTIVMTDATASSTVSITHHQTSDPEVATFDAVDETGVFMWTGTEWITIFASCTFV